MVHRVIGRASGILALAVAPVFFLGAVLSTVVLGTYNDLAMPLLAFGATALLAGLGLSLVNELGVKPWFDNSGQFARPITGTEWAVKILSLCSAVLFLLSVTPLGVTVALSGSEHAASGLGTAVLTGLVTSVALAAVGGILHLSQSWRRRTS